ncbi:endonuclease/exonuclease/phosphatase family protein [Hydrogenophaga taeniospiralis]|uniref:endonuclease/exonuclease/phosphatase family protein n=1 Tax=Hydrogenophaga taeniospiralis TaxID=65656 RepID=UPI001CFB1C83|nr:endonuclease/exonuclease/phosphatase family protein [Hydrogenophaga taeniospiralis]MCB4362711.1 endonuclease/exonuclease/phosphatase family protein [Hydrogenophaga taeniospiralis]
MRVLSWNLGHQTREALIRVGFTPALRALAPDVLVLNEFVDGPTRGDLRALLRSLGLTHVHCSTRMGRHNQVLIAAREECALGELRGPRLEGGAGESNLLHVHFSSGVELVGLRAPTYERQARSEYWDNLSALIRSTSLRPIAWVGDLNADPDNHRSFGGKYLSNLEREGWLIPRAKGEWSFYRGSRIDHVLVSQALACTSAEYVHTLDGVSVAGPSVEDHVSDHAALLATISLKARSEP